MHIGWHSTLAHNIAIVAVEGARGERSADEQTSELLAALAREWRLMVKDVRFAFYGGVDSPDRQRAYVARRIAETRKALRPYLHRPAMRAYDEALEAVEMELG
jgi:hypothetical protein